MTAAMTSLHDSNDEPDPEDDLREEKLRGLFIRSFATEWPDGEVAEAMN